MNEQKATQKINAREKESKIHGKKETMFKRDAGGTSRWGRRGAGGLQKPSERSGGRLGGGIGKNRTGGGIYGQGGWD